MLEDDGTVALPNAFLPTAERYNLMSKIDHWVIRSVFRSYAGKHGLFAKHNKPVQLASYNFV